MPATAFAATFAALYAAHQVGDHWIQTHHQAVTKGSPGSSGRVACTRHVATLTSTKGIALGLVVLVTGLSLNPLAIIAGLAVDALSHYWADRQTTLTRLARRVGKAEFAALGDGFTAPAGTGAYALDQSWHIGWLFAAALLASIGATS